MSRTEKSSKKIRTCYFFDDLVNINKLGTNNTKIDEISYKNILIYYFGNGTTKIIKLLYLIINNANRYIEENNGNRYLTLVLNGA